MSTLAEIEAAVVSLTSQEMAHLENLLHELRAQAEETELQEIYRVIGLHPLPKRGNASITNEMVQKLREEEDIF
jgi:N-acetylglutamate synthase-like GNAT family acetyltransferase